MDDDIGEFARVFGATPRNRILEFFLALRTLDYAIGDVARECSLNRATTYNTMAELAHEGIVVPSRVVGRTQLYKLNMAKDTVKKLLEVFDLLLAKVADEYSDELVVEE